MFAKEMIDDRTFISAQQCVAGKSAIQDMEGLILSAAGKQEGIPRRGFLGGLRPAAGAEGPADIVVLRFRQWSA